MGTLVNKDNIDNLQNEQINNNKIVIKDDKENNNNSVLNDLKCNDNLKILKQGEVFTKYGKYGNPHLRFVKLTDDERRIVWHPVSGCGLLSRPKFLEVSEVNLF
jgi:hypothetical protein